MKKLLSYLFPITKKISSNINGELEITWVDGKKYLNSLHTNYSYGSLQRILDFGLSKVNFHQEANLLLLGLGGGSVLKTLREKHQHKGKITAIEIDEVVIQIADKEFGIKQDENLTILCTDAMGYVQQCQQVYDLVIIDIFIDDIVPIQFFQVDFWEKLSLLIQKNGYFIFNAGIHQIEEEKFSRICTQLATYFDLTRHEQVEGANTLLVGKKQINKPCDIG
ncbi:MAG: methyltransferase domain-containing protein [Thermoflexibacter sp.]